jgi:hypothetical protein
MTPTNYSPNLARRSAIRPRSLGTVIAKAQELAQADRGAHRTLIITDGGDYNDALQARDVKAIVDDMLAQENHIVAAMGISDGTTDFKAVFRAMGIPDRWILTPGNSASEIRRAFAVFSQSAVRASQGAQLGGFRTERHAAREVAGLQLLQSGAGTIASSPVATSIVATLPSAGTPATTPSLPSANRTSADSPGLPSSRAALNSRLVSIASGPAACDVLEPSWLRSLEERPRGAFDSQYRPVRANLPIVRDRPSAVETRASGGRHRSR